MGVDVVLLNTTLGGGIRPCIKAAAVCETPRFPGEKYRKTFPDLPGPD